MARCDEGTWHWSCRVKSSDRWNRFCLSAPLNEMQRLNVHISSHLLAGCSWSSCVSLSGVLLSLRQDAHVLLVDKFEDRWHLIFAREVGKVGTFGGKTGYLRTPMSLQFWFLRCFSDFAGEGGAFDLCPDPHAATWQKVQMVQYAVRYCSVTWAVSVFPSFLWMPSNISSWRFLRHLPPNQRGWTGYLIFSVQPGTNWSPVQKCRISDEKSIKPLESKAQETTLYVCIYIYIHV